VDLRLAAALGWVSDSDMCLAAQMSLLNCLCAAIPARERVITAEEVFELPVPLLDIVAIRTGPGRCGGRGARTVGP
jgi:Flp pilus assembly CpaF family ATPase